MKSFTLKFFSVSILTFFFISILSSPQSGYAQIVKNNLITIGTVDKIHSKILNEDREIWVYVPASFNDSLFSSQKYPVAYLFDGDAHFPSVMGMIQQLSGVNGNSICPEMILVGIPHTDRMRDLTPTHVTTAPFMDSASVSTTGGGEKFTDFMEKELIPHIDSLYPTTPYRMLIGHSIGGLMVVNTLIHHPDLFNAYIAIDPSMWWDNHKLLNESSDVFKKKKFDGKTLFLAMANTLPDGLDTSDVRKDTSTSPSINHPRSILQLSDILKSNAQNGLRWNWKYYREDDHGSVPLIAEYDALHFIFNGYKFSLPEPEKLNSINVDSMIITHYENLSKMMGYPVLPTETMVNELGYNFLQQKMFEKSFAFFKMNIDNYPKSFNVYDSMGDYYNAKDDKQKAIEYFSKALELKDFPETKRKLEMLKSGK